jgi:hypothetical protein
LIEINGSVRIECWHLDPAWCTDRLIDAEGPAGMGRAPFLSRKPDVLFKLNQDRRRHIPRQQHRVTNWPAYDIVFHGSRPVGVWRQAGPIVFDPTGDQTALNGKSR